MKRIVFITTLLSATLGWSQPLTLPYSNNFDTPSEMSEWTAVNGIGTNDWQVGAPNFSPFTSALSGTNAWVTNLNGYCATNSTRYLETPDFDFTTMASNQVLSFYQSSTSGSTRRLEYSLDGGTTWQLLDNASAPKKSWQDASGFTGSSTTFYQSAIRINFLQGNSTVRFRFNLSTTGVSTRGWMIDNFFIGDEYYNVVAHSGDPILDVSPYFSTITVTSVFEFSNQYFQTYTFSNPFYLSTDNVLDGSDTYLGTSNLLASSTSSNWTYTFNLPSGLATGDYYILYKLDNTNVLAENDETDNIGATLLQIAPIYTVISDDLENGSTWKKTADSTQLTWQLGDPNNWHVEDPHSGENAWYSGPFASSSFTPTSIQSPWVDLTTPGDHSLCFWFKNSSVYEMTSYIESPNLMTTNITYPYFPGNQNNPNNQIPQPRRYGWDCYCKDLSGYSSQQSTKFRINASGNTDPISLQQLEVDDIYIGPSLPDVSVEGETKNRYTPNTQQQDTVHYLLYNSGLTDLVSTTTKIYWSVDPVYDGSDLLLSTITEPALSDTDYVEKTVTITKPTLAEGTYYLIFLSDVNDQVTEMRENNNVFVTEYIQTAPATLPYFNDFETEINGWGHTSTLGNDDWQWGEATGTYIDTCFSGEKAFITNANGDTVSLKSRSHLFTPVFDLSELSDPVLEFDLYGDFYNDQYSYWPYNMGNIMYSEDGGFEWKTLEAQNESFKGMYHNQSFNNITCNDEIPTNGTAIYHGELLYGKEEPIFVATYSYQTRYYDENTHYALDLSFLQGKQVRFAFIYANHDAPTEGMLLDNFSIRDKEVDLMIPTEKKILAANGDKNINVFFHVKNNNNYISAPTNVRLYCSTNDTWDTGDILVSTQSVSALMPFQKQLINVYTNAPSNYANYNYLLCKIDAANTNVESNESNNLHVFDLAMDSCSEYSYPLVYDFEEEYIDGWSWRHDGTGQFHGGTFRTQVLEIDPIVGGNDGEWMLDPLDQGGYNVGIDQYPTYYLESPTYDFSGLHDIEMAFDFLCVGVSGNASEGGNLSCSTDGGLTWTVMSHTQDPNAINWYNIGNISTLNNQPGWYNNAMWTHATYHPEFLSGESNVRFRFNYKGKSNAPYVQGFRLDNFSLNGSFVDLVAADQDTIYVSLSQNTFVSPYTILNNGETAATNCNTSFFWSEDDFLDGGDLWIDQQTNGTINAGTLQTFNKTITYPTPITQYTYYLFHEIDPSQTIGESNENNNIGKTVVIFDAWSSVEELENDVLMASVSGNTITVKTPYPDQSVNVVILNSPGQLVYEQTATADAHGNLSLPINTLSTGIYFLRVVSGNQTGACKFVYSK